MNVSSRLLVHTDTMSISLDMTRPCVISFFFFLKIGKFSGPYSYKNEKSNIYYFRFTLPWLLRRAITPLTNVVLEKTHKNINLI